MEFQNINNIEKGEPVVFEKLAILITRNTLMICGFINATLCELHFTKKLLKHRPSTISIVAISNWLGLHLARLKTGKEITTFLQ